MKTITISLRFALVWALLGSPWYGIAQVDSEALHERFPLASHEVPEEFVGAKAFLEFIKPFPSNGGQEALQWNAAKFMGYISAHGVTFESEMEGDVNGLVSPAEIKSAISSRRGGIFEAFKYLAITYARNSRKSSQLDVRKDSDEYIVEMGVYYKLVFANENGRLCLTEFHYINYDGED